MRVLMKVLIQLPFRHIEELLYLHEENRYEAENSSISKLLKRAID
jgi:hypothetical protein